MPLEDRRGKDYRRPIPLPAMPYQRYLAELLGTFTLTFAVWLSVAFAMPFPAPVMAALTVGLFVYLIGELSGAQLNPAVTIGILSIGRISVKDAVWYIVSQFAGAGLAMLFGTALSGETASIPHDSYLSVGLAEAIGAFFLVFTIATVVQKKVDPIVSGIAIGSSLLLGIYLAFPFSNGVLNPAVAFGIGSFGAMYILGPIVGGVAGAWASVKLFEGKAFGPQPPAVRT
jgi:glycerol uptake facilitator-like aquaporin